MRIHYLELGLCFVGSDSGSSSGSESEEDSVQSPFVESKGTEAVT